VNASDCHSVAENCESSHKLDLVRAGLFRAHIISIVIESRTLNKFSGYYLEVKLALIRVNTV
jgi:hypothetical protein